MILYNDESSDYVFFFFYPEVFEKNISELGKVIGFEFETFRERERGYRLF